MNLQPDIAGPHRPVVIPEKSSVRVINLREVASEEVGYVIGVWNRIRGEAALPSRNVLSMRALGVFVRNVSLSRVVDGGADYEFRIVGDAHAQAYGPDRHQHKSVSEVIADTSEYGKQLKASFDYVRTSGQPLAFRGLIGRDIPDARFVWFEAAYLPFGENGVVDHIVTAAVYAPKGGAWEE